MRSRLVAAADEQRTFIFDFLQGFRGGFRSLDSRRIRSRSDNDKIIIHQGNAFNAVAVRNEFFFQGLGMSLDQIDIAFCGNIQRRSRAGSDMTHPDACFFFKLIFQNPDNTGIDRTDGAGQEHKLVPVGCQRQR